MATLTHERTAELLAMLTPEQLASLTATPTCKARERRCRVCRCLATVYGCGRLPRNRKAGGYDGCRRPNAAPLPYGWDALPLMSIQPIGPAGLPSWEDTQDATDDDVTMDLIRLADDGCPHADL